MDEKDVRGSKTVTGLAAAALEVDGPKESDTWARAACMRTMGTEPSIGSGRNKSNALPLSSLLPPSVSPLLNQPFLFPPESIDQAQIFKKGQPASQPGGAGPGFTGSGRVPLGAWVEPAIFLSHCAPQTQTYKNRAELTRAESG